MTKADTPITILFFVRWPEAGRVKTRLAAGVGAEEACRVHAMLARHCFSSARLVPDSRLVVCGTGAEGAAFAGWLPGADAYWEQPEGGLGDRLSVMFRRGFDEFGGGVLAIGSDAPTLDAEAITTAAAALGSHDVSILPAEDGGYVLIGMRLYSAELFADMPWSTDRLLAVTRERCLAQDLSLHIGATFPDVDTLDDWNRLSTHLAPKS